MRVLKAQQAERTHSSSTGASTPSRASCGRRRYRGKQAAVGRSKRARQGQREVGTNRAIGWPHVPLLGVGALLAMSAGMLPRGKK